MNLFETIVAYAEPAANTAATGAAGTMDPAMAGGGVAAMITSFLPLVFVMVLLYLMMIRPQRKKEKELKKKIDAMKIGDKIVTIGGIVGKVNKIKDNTVTIETGNIGTPTEKSYIKIEREAIRTVEQKLSN